jgi:hypothetical protein
MDADGGTQTFFVVASTDIEGANILMSRVREQIGGLPKFQASGLLSVTAEAIPSSRDAAKTIEQLVWEVADRVTDLIQQGFRSAPPHYDDQQ